VIQAAVIFRPITAMQILDGKNPAVIEVRKKLAEGGDDLTGAMRTVVDDDIESRCMTKRPIARRRCGD
jgi:hypothetical protein